MPSRLRGRRRAKRERTPIQPIQPIRPIILSASAGDAKLDEASFSLVAATPSTECVLQLDKVSAPSKLAGAARTPPSSPPRAPPGNNNSTSPPRSLSSPHYGAVAAATGEETARQLQDRRQTVSVMLEAMERVMIHRTLSAFGGALSEGPTGTHIPTGGRECLAGFEAAVARRTAAAHALGRESLHHLRTAHPAVVRWCVTMPIGLLSVGVYYLDLAADSAVAYQLYVAGEPIWSAESVAFICLQYFAVHLVSRSGSNPRHPSPLASPKSPRQRPMCMCMYMCM